MFSYQAIVCIPSFLVTTGRVAKKIFYSHTSTRQKLYAVAKSFIAYSTAHSANKIGRDGQACLCFLLCCVCWAACGLGCYVCTGHSLFSVLLSWIVHMLLSLFINSLPLLDIVEFSTDPLELEESHIVQMLSEEFPSSNVYEQYVDVLS